MKESLAREKDTPDPLAERLDRLESALGEQAARVRVIEQYLSAVSQGGQRPRETVPPAQASAASAPPPLPSLLPPPTSAASAPRPRADLETRIGGSWLSRIGILSIAFAAAFFLKYAFENEWIGARTRIFTGIAVGLACVVAGERLRTRGYANYAQSFSGGGIMILYLAVFAAYNFYNLIAQFPALVWMTAITIAAVLLSLRANSLPIAALGFIGGYLTPVLLSTGVDRQAALFTYLAILDAGALALAYLKRWRVLSYVAFAASLALVGGWCLQFYEPRKLWMTLGLTTLLFLLFVAYSAMSTASARRKAWWVDGGLALAVAVFYFGLGYALLFGEGYRRGALASLAVSLCVLYALLYYALRSRDVPGATFLVLSIAFLTVALGLRFEGYATTIAWTCEATLLIWAATRSGSKEARRAGAIIFLLAVLHWAGVDAHDVGASGFAPLFNRRALSCAILIGGLLTAAHLNRRSSEGAEKKAEKLLNNGFVIAAHVLAVTLLSLDASRYFTLAGNANDELIGSRGLPSLAGQLALSIIWTMYGGALLLAGVWRHSRLLRLLGLCLLGLTIFKVFLFDLAALERFYRIVSFVVLGAILLAVSFLYQQRQRQTSQNHLR